MTHKGSVCDFYSSFWDCSCFLCSRYQTQRQRIQMLFWIIYVSQSDCSPPFSASYQPTIFPWSHLHYCTGYTTSSHQTQRQLWRIEWGEDLRFEDLPNLVFVSDLCGAVVSPPVPQGKAPKWHGSIHLSEANRVDKRAQNKLPWQSSERGCHSSFFQHPDSVVRERIPLLRATLKMNVSEKF